MVHYSKVVQGIATYIDNELVGRLAGSWKAWAVGGLAGIALTRADQLFHSIKNNAFITALGLVEGEMINTDLLMGELRKQAQKGTATVNLPLIGAVTFGTADVDALHRYINA